MTERIRFHLDEHVDPDIARALRRYGIDATTTVEAGLRTKSDEELFSYVQRERRVVITHDVDFLRFAAEASNHPGIAYCQKTARSMGEIIRSLILIYEVLTDEDMAGHVEYL